MTNSQEAIVLDSRGTCENQSAASASTHAD